MDEIQYYNSGNSPEQENNIPQHKETTTAYTGFVYDSIPNDFQAVPELPESIRKRKNTSGPYLCRNGGAPYAENT